MNKFLKYCVVGVSGTLVDLGVLYLMVEYVGLPVLLGATVSFVMAVTNNFLLNKTWTFKNKSRNYRKLYIKFFIVSLVGLALTLSFMYVFVDLLAIWYMLAKAMTSVIVLVWNFLGNKLWTFRLNERVVEMPEKFEHKFSIVIPAYNEEYRVKNTLLAVDDYVRSAGLDAEIIVVSDGSSDGTDEVVKKYMKRIAGLRLVSYKENQGKGHAVKKGVEASKGEFVLFADADNSTPIEELENLYQAMKKKDAEVVIGSRYMSGSDIRRKQPWYRVAMGRIGNILIRAFLVDGVKDTQCGFKLFKHRAAKEIFSFQKVKRFGFDMEALVVAENLGYKIVEVPVSWFNSPESRVRPVKDGLRTLRDLVYIKLNLWSGRYESE